MRLTARTPTGLAYEAAGNGPDVLLMHSGISDSRMWDPQWAALTARFHAIRYDARGFGSSADPRRPYTLHGDGMDVLDALDVERAAVVGSSMGGYAALDMAIALPHRVSALVVVSARSLGLGALRRRSALSGRRSTRRTRAAASTRPTSSR